MQIRFRQGPMPSGGMYQEFAEMLARFYRTFEPLKARGGEDARDFLALKANLEGFAGRHDVAGPEVTLSEEDGLSGYATPFEVLDHLSALVRDFGLCHRRGGADDLARTALGQLVLGIFHRYAAIEASFDRGGDGRKVAVGVLRWLRPDGTPMRTILEPRRAERSDA